MRKLNLIMAGVGLLSAVSMATAADTVQLYFNSGCESSAAAHNSTLYIGHPTQDATLAALPVFNGPVNYHTGKLEVYMKVSTNGGAGCGGETMSAWGTDVRKVQTGGTSTLTATGFVVKNTAASTTASQIPWSGFNSPTFVTQLVNDSRAVAVPAGHSPGETLWNGFCPRAGAYDAATLTVVSGGPALGTAGNATSTFALRMNVGALKITRVYDPTAAQGAANENVRFGTGDAATDNGSVVGVQNNLIADATVIARKKGDFGSFDGNGNFLPVPDGVVSSAEAAQFLADVGTTCASNALNAYLGDFGSFDGNGVFSATPDGVVSSAEYAQFLAAVGS